MVWSMPLAALALLVATGIIGVGRGAGFGEGMSDNMMYLYNAGDMWLEGASPYVRDEFVVHGRDDLSLLFKTYAYAPQSAPLSMLLASVPVFAAQVGMTLLNLLALGVLVWLSIRWLKENAGETLGPNRDFAYAMTAAVIVGNPFTAHVVWMGQTALISAASVLLAMYAIYNGRDWIGGALLGFSTFKPQVVLLFIFWLLLDRKFRALAIGGFMAVAYSLWPMLTTGVRGTWQGWLGSLRDYGNDGVTAVTFQHTFGLRSLLAEWGADLPIMPVLALPAVYLLYRRRDELGMLAVCGLLFAASTLFVYAHDYDLAVVTGLAPALYWTTRGRPALQMAAVACAFTLFFPQRILRHFELQELLRSRELALVLLSVMLVVLSLRPGDDAESEEADLEPVRGPA